MSSAILFTVNLAGDVEQNTEYRNSWGGAALIWDYFTEKYFPLGPGQQRWQRKVGMLTNMQPVWDLWKREDLPEAERIVLMSTFDNVMIHQEDLETVADAYELVESDMGKYCENLPNRANHMRPLARKFRELAADPNIQAVCFQWTTVAENPWWINAEEPEDAEEIDENYEFTEEDWGHPYNINTGTKHWFLLEADEEGE